MGQNTFFHNQQFGHKQLSIISAMSEGAGLFSSYFFYEKKKKNNYLIFDDNEIKLWQREVNRLMHKGCIKIVEIMFNGAGLFYKYELTNHYKKILKDESKIN